MEKPLYPENDSLEETWRAALLYYKTPGFWNHLKSSFTGTPFEDSPIHSGNTTTLMTFPGVGGNKNTMGGLGRALQDEGLSTINGSTLGRNIIAKSENIAAVTMSRVGQIDNLDFESIVAIAYSAGVTDAIALQERLQREGKSLKAIIGICPAISTSLVDLPISGFLKPSISSNPRYNLVARLMASNFHPKAPIHLFLPEEDHIHPDARVLPEPLGATTEIIGGGHWEHISPPKVETTARTVAEYVRTQIEI